MSMNQWNVAACLACPWEHLSAPRRHLGRFRKCLVYLSLPSSPMITVAASPEPSTRSESVPTTSSGLLEDIWGEIAVQLSASDALSLSQTCTELYSFLSRWDLWARILRAVCRRHGVFLPTYPASKSEITVDQLVRAALRPERWHRLVRKRAAPFAPWDDYSSMRRNFDDHPAITPTFEGAFSHMSHCWLHLIPGGRFLVLIDLPTITGIIDVDEAETTTAILSIRDLGVPGSTEHRAPSIVASQPFDIACTLIPIAQSSQSAVGIVSGSLFRVVMVHPLTAQSHANSPNLSHWRVIAFDVEFSANGGNSPSLKRHRSSVTIDTVRGNARVVNICLQGNLVLLRFSGLVVVWDPDMMKYISLKAHDWNARRYLSVGCVSMLTSHHLVSIGVETLGVWDISSLCWIDGGLVAHIDEASTQAVPPDMVISGPWKLNRKALNRIEFSQVPCPVDSDNRVYFDAHYKQGGDGIIARYQLDVAPLAPGSLIGLPIAEPEARLSLTLVSATRFPTSKFSTNVELAHGRLCHVRKHEVGGQRAYAYVPSSIPSPPLTALGKLVEETALTTYVCLGTRAPQAFCALSGRMICKTLGEDVKVVEYLS